MNPNINIQLKLGIAFIENREWSESLKCFNKVLQKDPINPTAIYYQSFALVYLGEIEAPVTFLKQYNRNIESIADVIIFFHENEAAFGNDQNAIDILEKGIDLLPEQKDFFIYKVADYSYKTGKYQEAVAAIKRGLYPQNQYLQNYIDLSAREFSRIRNEKNNKYPNDIKLNDPYLNHVILITGYAQLIYALSALEREQIDLKNCRVQIYFLMVDYMQARLEKLLAHFNLQTVEIIGISADDMVCKLRENLNANDVTNNVLWVNNPSHKPDVNKLAAYLNPCVVCSFYDGFWTPPIYKRICDSKLQNQKIYEGYKAIIHDKLIMPDYGVWDYFLDEEFRAKLTLIPLNIVYNNFKRVIECLDQIEDTKEHLQADIDIDVVITVGIHAERGLDLQKEILIYHDIINKLQNIKSDCRIIIKAHPRITEEKMYQLKSLANDSGCVYADGSQLIEKLYIQNTNKKILVIASPSTALITAKAFNNIIPVNLTASFMTNYLGSQYINTDHNREAHKYMSLLQIIEISELNELEQLVSCLS